MYLARDAVNRMTEGAGLSDKLSHAEERGEGGDGARENTGEVQLAAHGAIDGGRVRAAGSTEAGSDPPWPSWGHLGCIYVPASRHWLISYSPIHLI